MSDPFKDRVAVVTGGAGGIGMALARAFAARGAPVVLADIDAAALRGAERELAGAGAKVRSVATDVTSRKSVEELAEAAFRFGPVGVVCNNAGIAVAGSMVGATQQEWEAAMAINVWGVVHGVDAFVPRLVAQGRGGHVVNTASMAGLVGMQYLGIYCATKFAVVGITESLERELRPQGIGVHVLCPMMVATDIARNSARVLGREAAPDANAAAGSSGAPPPGALKGGVIPADDVARRTLRGIERGDLYILTHPEQRAILERRWRRQDAVFEPDAWR
jgi:NAD(P)-dependent dehydrogenase (short-subunit alcohol dehydrogenase family)